MLEISLSQAEGDYVLQSNFNFTEALGSWHEAGF